MQLDIHCKKHPKYKALKPPKSCSACFVLYALKGRIGAKEVGVKQIGLFMLQANPGAGVLVAK